MKRLIIGIIVALIVGAGIVGALSLMDSKEPTTQTAEQAPQTTQTETIQEEVKPTESESTSSVAIENLVFSPAEITIKKGTTVTWTNKDSVAHTVTADDGNGPNSQLFEQGETYSYKFDEVGTFKYHCQPHPSMKGTVVVQ